jgi:toxin ParE1/3/4
MSYEIYKHPQAMRDIEEAFVYLAEGNLNIGVTFLAMVEDSLEQLSDFPFIGKKRNFSNVSFAEIRMWQVKEFEKYLIFYQVIEQRIEVVRVLHGSRNLEDLFG